MSHVGDGGVIKVGLDHLGVWRDEKAIVMAEKLHRQQRRWSYWSRAIAATVGICVALVLVGYARSSAAEARDDMRSILDAISNESTAVTNEYLAGPETAAQLVAGLRSGSTADTQFEQALFANLITATSQIEAVFVGYPNGTFNFVARSGQDEAAFRIRTIDGPDLVMTETFARVDLTPVSSAPIPDSTYDPRQRSWFQPIAAGADSAWSDPYVFASSGKLGVTHSVGVHNTQDELVAVVGVDLTLDQLVAFLKDRRPSPNGSAQVVNNNGVVLAGSETDVQAMSESDADLPAMPRASAIIQNAMSPLDNAPVNERFTNGDRWGNIREVGKANRGWFLLVESPRSDFNAEPRGLASSQSFQILLWSLATAGLAYVFLTAGGRRLLRLNTMATVDELTNVLNRAGIFRELSAVLTSTGDPDDVVVAIIDLDRFKAVNDSHGHTIGDKTLQQVAQRFAQIVEGYGMQCGRLGGDEFVVFGDVPNHEAATPMWDEIREAVKSLASVDGAEIDLSASIGVAAFQSATPIDVTAALHLADRALYEVKRAGGDTTRFSVHSFDSLSEPDANSYTIDTTHEDELAAS